MNRVRASYLALLGYVLIALGKLEVSFFKSPDFLEVSQG